jgi:phage-related protein
VIETTGRRIHRGKIGSLFDLNGERAIHIETSDGQNLIFTASQVCDLKLLHDPVNHDPVNHNPVNEEPRPEEVIVIEDEEDEEVQQITQTMETIHILSDSDECSSDATTECLEDDDNDNDNDDDDDFPDVPFRPARQQDAVADEEVAEEEVADDEPNNCCAVCFDATDAARNFVSLDCGHQFHFACIMGNMANGGNNRNQCPLCRSAVLQAYDVQNLDEVYQMRMDEMVENAASHNQRLQDELNLSRQHREDLSAEYMRVMSMNMQIGIRHAEEREARDVLERRAYICGLNERIAAIVANASNNDIRQYGAAMHTERQIRDLCMSFGMMAYDAQYDEDQGQGQGQGQGQPLYYDEDLMEVD